MADFEEMKKEADKAPEKYRNALRFLRNHTFDFDGEYYFISRTYNEAQEATGSFKLIPLSFKVMIRVGTPTLYLSCRAEFKKIEFKNSENNKILKDFLNSGISGTQLLNISNVFKHAPDMEFNKLKPLIGMSDVSLLIDEVDIEDLK